MFTEILSKAHWSKKRKAYIRAARECRETLIDPNSHWRYAPDDQRVKEAVSKWVGRARHAHAVAMGRKPVIANAVFIDNHSERHGSLYAA